MDCNLYLVNSTSHIAFLLSSINNQQLHGLHELPADLNQGRNWTLNRNQSQTGHEFLSAETFRDPSTTVKLSANPPSGTSRHILHCLTLVVIPIAILGMLGNMLNIFVLTRKQLLNSLDRMEKSVNVGLVALAVSDFLFCLLFLAAISPEKAMYSPLEYSVLQYFRLYQVGQCLCVCVYVCVYVYVYVCLYMYVYEYVYECMCLVKCAQSLHFNFNCRSIRRAPQFQRSWITSAALLPLGALAATQAGFWTWICSTFSYLRDSISKSLKPWFVFWFTNSCHRRGYHHYYRHPPPPLPPPPPSHHHHHSHHHHSFPGSSTERTSTLQYVVDSQHGCRKILCHLQTPPCPGFHQPQGHQGGCDLRVSGFDLLQPAQVLLLSLRQSSVHWAAFWIVGSWCWCLRWISWYRIYMLCLFKLST